MKRFVYVFVALTILTLGVAAQSKETGPATTASAGTKTRPPIFRPTKDQIMQVQTKLRTANLYSGESTGKLDKATRASIKEWQGGNGLKKTGTLNRATLEKMGIELTENQKLMPVSESSYAESEPAKASKKETSSASGTKPKRTIFRATKDQIIAAQNKLKAGSMYSGDAHGKLDTATRDGLGRFQEANGLKVTKTLNQATLEKMGIELTDKQKAAAATTSESAN
ncbi:MAG: peptidoglycan-binding domain-containing protein [Pyrinomonadaceae bacterium]